jgi:hypothetical protein
MGTSLTGLTPGPTYVSLLKTTDNTALSTTLKVVTDGAGNNSALELATDKVKLTNPQFTNGTYNVSSDELGYLDGVSSAIQTQLNGKQDTLVSATNIKTINSTTLLGSGNIAVEPTITATTSADYYRGDKTFATLNKTAVGLGNCDNTSDANKPVSTAQQTALDLKTNKLIVANRQTASYTLVLSDADKLVEMNVGSANNLTVPASVFAAGNQILLAQYGAGQTTIVAGSGMTIRSNGAKLKLNAQYSGATLVFISASEAYLFGDIA